MKKIHPNSSPKTIKFYSLQIPGDRAHDSQLTNQEVLPSRMLKRFGQFVIIMLVRLFRNENWEYRLFSYHLMTAGRCHNKWLGRK